MMYYVKSYDDIPDAWIYAHTVEDINVYFIDGRAKLVPDLNYLSYRADELHPEAYELLKYAFLTREKILYHSNIDTVIKLQEYCLEKAKCYIGYMWLGTHTYLDVFGEKAARYFEEVRKQEKEDAKQRKLDNIERQLEAMQLQMWEMQKLLVNMAKQQNKQTKSFYSNKSKII